MLKTALFLVLLVLFSTISTVALSEEQPGYMPEKFQLSVDGTGSRGWLGKILSFFSFQQTFTRGSGETFQPGDKAEFTVNYKPRSMCLDTFYVLELYKDGQLSDSVNVCDKDRTYGGDHPCRKAGKSVLAIDEGSDLGRTFWMDFSVDLPSSVQEGKYGVVSYILCMNSGYALVSSVEEGWFNVEKPAPPAKYSDSCKTYSGQCQGKYLLTDLNVAATDAIGMCEYIWINCAEEKPDGYCSTGQCRAGCDSSKKDWDDTCSTKGEDGCGEEIRRSKSDVEGISCGAGKTCQDGECVKDDKCSRDRDCDSDEECVYGACVEKIEEPEPESEPEETPEPEPSSEFETECETDSDCASNEECLLGVCVIGAEDENEEAQEPDEPTEKEEEEGFTAYLKQNWLVISIVAAVIIALILVVLYSSTNEASAKRPRRKR